VHRYTNMTDLNFFWRLSRLPAFYPDRAIIRYARDLQVADLRGSNLILLGARRANPWVELFLIRRTIFKGFIATSAATTS
jgi:hypothetical protein